MAAVMVSQILRATQGVLFPFVFVVLTASTAAAGE